MRHGIAIVLKHTLYKDHLLAKQWFAKEKKVHVRVQLFTKKTKEL